MCRVIMEEESFLSHSCVEKSWRNRFSHTHMYGNHGGIVSVTLMCREIMEESFVTLVYGNHGGIVSVTLMCRVIMEEKSFCAVSAFAKVLLSPPPLIQLCNMHA